MLQWLYKQWHAWLCRRGIHETIERYVDETHLIIDIDYVGYGPIGVLRKFCKHCMYTDYVYKI